MTGTSKAHIDCESEDKCLLMTISRYLLVATLVNPNEQSGRETIDRALQVFGDRVNGTRPNLSNKSHEIFKRRNMQSVIVDGIEIRHHLSHSNRPYVVLAKRAIQSEIGLYRRVQNDLKRLVVEISRVLYCVENKCVEAELDEKERYPAITEYKEKFDHVEITRQNIDRLLDEASRALGNARDSEQVYRELDKKRQIHAMKLKINETAVVQSLPDSYGEFVNACRNIVVTNRKICPKIDKFLKSLQLDEKVTKEFKKSIIITVFDKPFYVKLNALNEILGDVGTNERKQKLIVRYLTDEELQASIEMILLDLCTIYSSVNSDHNNLVKQLRNRLAHEDALTDGSPNDALMDIISWAIRFVEKGQSVTTLRHLKME